MKNNSFEGLTKKYLIMLGKEYEIKTFEDEASVFKKQKRIQKKTGRKPRIILSMRSEDYENH